ncbi:uncharacterized protein LOC101857670 isoform X2 [Aplysia californica]|nr:uncharacterized protein LOC101857670 isoform X2 [Aplysia californica]
MDDGASRDAFLSSVLRAVREACTQHLDFKARVCTTGFLCVDLDGERQNHFVLNEVFRKVKEDSSNSFCLKTIDTKSSKTQNLARPAYKDYRESHSCTPVRKAFSSRSPRGSGSGRYMSRSSAMQPSEIKKSSICLKPTAGSTKPSQNLFWKSRRQKVNRTFTIESDNESKYKIKPRQEPCSIVCATASPKKVVPCHRPANHNVIRASGSIPGSECNVTGVSSRGRKHTARLCRESSSETISHSTFVKAAETSKTFQYPPINRCQVNNANLCCPSLSDGENSSDTELQQINDRFDFFQPHNLNDPDISIASTKPPHGFVQSNLDIFVRSPRAHKSENFDTPQARNPCETLSTPNFLKEENISQANPQDISALLNNVIAALSQTQHNDYKEERPLCKPPASPVSCVMGDYREPSLRSVDSLQRANLEYKFEDDMTPLKNRDVMHLMYKQHGGSPKGCAEVTDSPSVIKKKAKLFKWMKLFKKAALTEPESHMPYLCQPQNLTQAWPVGQSANTSKVPSSKREELATSNRWNKKASLSWEVSHKTDSEHRLRVYCPLAVLISQWIKHVKSSQLFHQSRDIFLRYFFLIVASLNVNELH